MLNNNIVSLLLIVFGIALFFSIKLNIDVVNTIENGEKKIFTLSSEVKSKCQMKRRLKITIHLIDKLGQKYSVQITKKECLDLDEICVYCIDDKCYSNECFPTRFTIILKFISGFICTILSIYYFFKP